MLAGEAFDAQRLARERAALVAQASAALREAPARIAVRYELRYRGQSFELSVAEDDASAARAPEALQSAAPPPSAGAPETPHLSARDVRGADRPPHPDALREAFARAHEQRYGYRDERGEVELVTIRVSAWGAAPAVTPAASRDAAPPARMPWTIVLDGVEVAAERLDGELPPGTRLRGPALCALPESTLLVPPSWEGEVDAFGTVHLEAAR
jgi:N-methylhydantoinase A